MKRPTHIACSEGLWALEAVWPMAFFVPLLGAGLQVSAATASEGFVPKSLWTWHSANAMIPSCTVGVQSAKVSVTPETSCVPAKMQSVVCATAF